MDKFFTIERFQSAVPQILSHLHITIEFFFVCILFATIFSIVMAVLRLQKIPVLHQILSVYISYMRGVPLLVQIMVVYYGLPLLVQALLGVNINRWDAIVFAEIAVIMNESAFFGEVVRGAILSIPAVQSEAGYSIGMTKFQTFFRIVLPQAIRVLIPAYGQMAIGLFQSTSILYIVGVADMMARARSITGITGHSFESYTVIAIVYIVVCLSLKFGFGLLERKMRYGRR